MASPRAFGNYLLDREIARGGMARVYLARLVGPGGFEKRLVVKQILPRLASEARFVAMFVEEAKTLVQLTHPHIVSVYELGSVDGTYFLAMEYIEGATLYELCRGGRLDAEWIAHVGAQLCDALAYAHERFGVVHRDVTPRNIIVDRAGHCRLLDFGIATPADGVGSTQLFGTPGYLSPEQARCETMGAPSDIFSLGAVLYEALAERAPFPADDLDSIRDYQDPAELPPLSEVDSDLEVTIRGALHPQAEARPNARQFEKSLRGWLAKRRPEGVAGELGERAEATRARRPEPQLDAAISFDILAARPSTSPTTLAASRAFAELMQGDVSAPLDTVSRDTVSRDTASSQLETSTVALRKNGAARAATPDGSSRPENGAADARRAPGRRTRWLAPAGILAVMVVSGAYALVDRRHDMGRPASERIESARSDIQARALDSNGATHVLESTQTLDTDATEESASTLYEAVTANLDAQESAAVTTVEPSRTDAPPSETVRSARTTPIRRHADTPSRSAVGTLTISARPWATITIDGRALGSTPLRGVELPAGTHTLRAQCPPLGRVLETTFRVEGRERRHAHIDLGREPPELRF